MPWSAKGLLGVQIYLKAAKRSKAALAKAHTRTLADGTPAMSFTRLLAHLATVVRNTLRPKAARVGESHIHPHHPPQPEAATGPRSDRRNRSVDSGAHRASISTD